MKAAFWTNPRFNAARKLRADGLTYEEIARALGCSKDSARCVFRRRAITPNVNVWTKEDFDTVARMRSEGATWAAIGLAIGRTTEAVKSKARMREYVPPKPSHDESRKGWPTVGYNLQANDDKYVARLLEAAKLEGCYGPSTARAA